MSSQQLSKSETWSFLKILIQCSSLQVDHSPGGNSNIVFIMQTTGHLGNGTFLKGSTGVRAGESCSCSTSTTVQFSSLDINQIHVSRCYHSALMWLVFTVCLGFVCRHWVYSKVQLTTTQQHQEQRLQCILWFGKHRNHSSVLTPLEVVWTELSEVLPAWKNWLHSCYTGSSSGS